MTAGIPGIPGGEPVQALTGDLSALVHREFLRVQQELMSPFRQARTGTRLLGGAAVLGSMAAGSATALTIRLLDRKLPPTASAAVVTAVFGAGASALAAAGRARLRAAWKPTTPDTATRG